MLGGIGALTQRVLRHRTLRLDDRLGRLADDDLARLGEFRFTPDDIDLVLLEQEADAVVHAGCNAARTGNDRLDVRLDRAFKRQAVILGMGSGVQHVGGAKQSLGRDAAPVGANAGKMFAFDDRDFHAELRGPDRSDITTRAGADYNNVISVGHERFQSSSVETPAKHLGSSRDGSA
ncbi:hypothetical protein D3C71_386070 [compost metagenome]